MFLHLSISHSVHGGGGEGLHPGGSASRAVCIWEVCIGRGLGRPTPYRRLRDTVKSWRYASYWNAFLFQCIFVNNLLYVWKYHIYLTGTELVGGKCVGKLQRGNYYIAFAISASSTFYALPSLALAILYGMVIFTLRIRVKETGSLGTSSVIEKASIQVRSLQ